MKRLVLCVEGAGDVAAMPALVGGALMADLPATHQGALFLDSKPMQVGSITQLAGKAESQQNWTTYLELAKRRKPLGGVLLILDGDEKEVEEDPFCAVSVARLMGERAKATGAGQLFSVAVVFLRMEYESLLIASYPTLTGHREGVNLPANVEEAPRDAKRWLSQHLAGGYRETQHQRPLTREVDFGLLRQKGVRCFRRLEHALRELVEAVQSDQHVVSPVPPATGEAPGT